MGLFDFIKNIGHSAPEPKPEPKPANVTPEQYQAALAKRRAAALTELIASHGFPTDGLHVELHDDVATLTGTVRSQEDREKIVLLVGNTKDIARVDDRLTVPGAPAEAPAAAAGAPAAGGTVLASTAGAPVGPGGSTFYTVEKGDTLSKIAKHFYGNANRYPEIFEANKPMLKDPDKIYPGQVLRIPNAPVAAARA